MLSFALWCILYANTGWLIDWLQYLEHQHSQNKLTFYSHVNVTVCVSIVIYICHVRDAVIVMMWQILWPRSICGRHCLICLPNTMRRGRCTSQYTLVLSRQLMWVVRLSLIYCSLPLSVLTEIPIVKLSRPSLWRLLSIVNWNRKKIIFDLATRLMRTQWVCMALWHLASRTRQVVSFTWPFLPLLMPRPRVWLTITFVLVLAIRGFALCWRSRLVLT